MSSLLTPSSDPGQSGRDVAALRHQIDAARARPDTDQDVLLAVLETAHEELRVASDEVAVQREALDQLEQSHEQLQLHQERVLAIVPVPVFVTDVHGTIRFANGAATLLARIRPEHVVGKPLVSLFDPDDRHELRSLLARRVLDREQLPVLRRTATLVPRHGTPVVVELTGTAGRSGATEGRITWFALSPAVDDERPVADVAGCLARLAVLPHRTTDLTDLLQRAVDVGREAIGEHVSIILGRPSAPRAVAYGSLEAHERTLAQVALGAGPSVQAHDTGEAVTTASLGGDPRWPQLGARLPGGVTQAVAVPVGTAEETKGVLTVYSDRTEPVPSEVVGLVAATLGAAVHELELVEELRRLEQDLERVTRSRAVIDQAKGILMSTYGLDADGAWHYLVRLSSQRERKVRDVAQDIVDKVARPG